MFNLMRRLLCLSLLIASVGTPAAPAHEPIRILLANVGNSNVFCQPYAFKLCFQAVEDRVSERIQSRAPDIVALIEVLPFDRCASAYAGAPELDPQKSCAALRSHEVLHQVQRLVGLNYAIACDARFGWDCLAVRRDRVRMAQSDDLAPRGLVTAPAIGGCDAGFTINAADIVSSPSGPFRVVLAHPDSGFLNAEAGRSCRTRQLAQAFELAQGPTLLLGDLNMDPYRSAGSDVETWDAQVGTGKRFVYHSGVAEAWPAPFTYFGGESSNLVNSGEMLPTLDDPSGTFRPSTIDHVASDFLDGACVTLQGDDRLDGGHGGGMDHRALDCTFAH